MNTAARAASPARPAHVPALDGLRGIAILLVTAYHFILQGSQLVDAQSLPARLLVRVAALGTYGVDLFFVLSGFLITGILLDAKDGLARERGRAPSRGPLGILRDFYARRALRIFPLYYAFLAVVLIVLPRVFPGNAMLRAAGQDQAWVWLYGTNFKIALEGHWAFCGTTSSICGQGLELNHLWSLAVEEHFYFVWPLLVLLCTRRDLLRVCVGLSVAALGMRFLLREDWLAVYTLTFCRMDALLAGAMVAIAARDAARRATLRRAGRGAVLAAAAVVAVLVGLPGGIEARSPALRALSFTLTAILSVGVLVATLDATPKGALGRVMRSVPLRVLGTYSYGLYVLHSALRPVWARLVDVPALARALHSPALAIFVYFVVATAGSLSLAWLSYHLFEKHFLVLKKHFEGRRRAPAGEGADESSATLPQSSADQSSPTLIVTRT